MIACFSSISKRALRFNDFFDVLTKQVAPGFSVIQGECLQDHTYFACIGFDTSMLKQNLLGSEAWHSMLFSNFDDLVTIVNYQDLKEEVLEKILQLLKHFAYDYVPYDIFDGDDILWQQLFDDG